MLCKFVKRLWPAGNVANVSESDFTICLFQYEESRPLMLKSPPVYLDRGDTFVVKGTGIPSTTKVNFDIDGTWGTDKKGRVSLSLKMIEEKFSKNEDGIVSYLSCGIFKGINEGLAKKIFDIFGVDSVRIIEEEPQKLLIVPGIKQKKLDTIVQSYKEYAGPRSAIKLLVPVGFTPQQAISAYSSFGSKVSDILETNPYKFCLADKITFPFLDKILLNEQNATSDGRIVAALLYVLDANEGTKAYNASLFKDVGNTIVNAQTWLSSTKRILNDSRISNQRLVDVAKSLAKNRLATFFRVKDKAYVARYNTCNAERIIAEKVKELLGCTKFLNGSVIEKEIHNLEKELNITLAPEQKQAIKMALSYNFSVITGGPGSGKTTIINFIRKIYKIFYPNAKILLCAPTGMAASRMTSATGYSAQTIHSALGLTPENNEKTQLQRNSLPWDLIIVDETSMLDVFLAKALLISVKPGTKVVFVGDANQLPSIGAGAVLHDLIMSKTVPSIILRKIFRQAAESLILTNSHDICENAFECKEGPDFQVVNSQSIENSKDVIIDLFLKEVAEKGVQNVTILSPFRKNTTPTSVDAINEAVHDSVNPPSAEKKQIKVGNTLFRVGDKVIQTKNSLYVANGDVGYITKIIPNKDPLFAQFTIDFGEKRIVEYFGREMDKIQLAYSTTVHKSQGSEYDSVILNIQREHSILLKRNLIYTAITRAKKKIVIVGDKFVLLNAAKSLGVKRMTSLPLWLNKK